jgi:hypothetical protein
MRLNCTWTVRTIMERSDAIGMKDAGQVGVGSVGPTPASLGFAKGRLPAPLTNQNSPSVCVQTLCGVQPLFILRLGWFRHSGPMFHLQGVEHISFRAPSVVVASLRSQPNPNISRIRCPDEAVCS